MGRVGIGRHSSTHKGLTALVAAAIGVVLAFSQIAGAEVSQEDGVRVSVTGKLSPVALPRKGEAPVSVSLAGHIIPTKPGALPKLQRIDVALNREGRLDTRAVPACRLGHIDPSTTAEALAACGRSVVGEGSFSANLKIPEQSPFPSQGKVLVFNGKLRGRPALFAHIYGTRPVPTSYVLPFTIKKTAGDYGTLLSASLPNVTGEWGYVTGISLNLKPEFISASCPAPAGLPSIVFPLMRTSFSFEGGPSLTTTLNRSCKVR